LPVPPAAQPYDSRQRDEQLTQLTRNEIRRFFTGLRQSDQIPNQVGGPTH
jgi:hypothetical protein